MAVAASASHGKCSLVKSNSSLKAKQIFRGKCPPGSGHSGDAEVPWLGDHSSSQTGRIYCRNTSAPGSAQGAISHQQGLCSALVSWLTRGFSSAGESQSCTGAVEFRAVLQSSGCAGTRAPLLLCMQAHLILPQFPLEAVLSASLHRPPDSEESTFLNTWLLFYSFSARCSLSSKDRFHPVV